MQGRDLMLVDLTAPYAFGCSVGGGSRSLMVPHEQLALPVDVIRRAVPRLRASPLHDLVRTHPEQVCGRAEELADDAGALALGTATAELVRAVIVSAAGGVRDRGAVREQTLTRVQTYVGQHLTDPALTPATIAAAHNVSLRQLYRLFGDAGLSLKQEVIGQWLELARAQLVSPADRRRSIAATARACGFADPAISPGDLGTATDRRRANGNGSPDPTDAGGKEPQLPQRRTIHSSTTGGGELTTFQHRRVFRMGESQVSQIVRKACERSRRRKPPYFSPSRKDRPRRCGCWILSLVDRPRRTSRHTWDNGGGASS